MTRPQVPAIAQDLARGLGADGTPWGKWVRLRQTGRMRQDASSAWMSFRARQTIRTCECGFDWRARTGPGGIVGIRDALAGGRGLLRVRALGFIPIVRAPASPDLTRGELMRYLAELPWAPGAILNNPDLRWRRDAPDRLVVGAGQGAISAEVTLALDRAGRIAEVLAPDRPRAVGRSFVPTPWRGRFLDYERHNGLWLPRRAEVAWVIGGTETCCFEGRIDGWRAAAGANAG